jgi:CHAT domain-containing protein/tetratricopeptide (TPR) repeat protein
VKLGDYTKAKSYYKRSLAIAERYFSSDPSGFATILNNLAGLCQLLGDFAKAELLYQRSLAIWQNALGPDHPNIASVLNNLAELYQSIGDYAKAEPLHIRSLSITEKTLGPNHPDIANSLNDLAVLSESRGDYARAEHLQKRALEIMEKAFGLDNPKVATSLNNLALLYMYLGDYARAEPLHKRSLDIRERGLGPNHSDVAESLNNLASLYQTLGNNAKAEPLYQRSLAIWQNALGPDHPLVATSLSSLARLYAALDDFQRSHDFYLKTMAIDEKLIDHVQGFTSESQKLAFLGEREGTLHSFLSLIDRYLSKDRTLRRKALDAWLERKGLVLEAQTRLQEVFAYSDDPLAVKTYQEFVDVMTQRSNLVYAGSRRGGLEIYKDEYAELEWRKERLEARLSRLSHAFLSRSNIAKADCEKVANAMPNKTALIDFARIRIFDFKTVGTERKWLPHRYIAFILHACNAESVGMINLGDADDIDRVVSLLRKGLGDVNDINRVRNASQEICRKVFEPVRNELGDVREVFISPDGNLNLIPFEILQGFDGRYLIEDYTFNYIATGRDILDFGKIKKSENKAVLMGDPDFDMGVDVKSATLRKLGINKVSGEGMKRSSDMDRLQFSRLEGTREEVEAIHIILGKERAEVYTDREALEEVLKQKDAPRILHLATHGFCLTDSELSNLQFSFMRDSLSRGLDMVMMPPMYMGSSVKMENPYIRSGIALAGANQALRAQGPKTSDGIVTAEKIFGLKLRGTDMVVLSACDTGLGEVRSGEGVFGLRRAFAQAGAKSLVMSLWKIPVEESKELMIAFYTNLQTGMSKTQALRHAILSEMEIVKKRDGVSRPHPFFWGGFVFAGEP